MRHCQAACATQTWYYLPKSWLTPRGGGDNVLTLFEAGAGGSPAHTGLALASMESGAGAASGGALDSVTSCAF